MRWGRLVAAWCLVLACAIANGALREAVLVPLWGRPAALVASGLLLSAVVLGVAVVLARWMGLPSRPSRATFAGGLLWLALTLAFEFGFGRGVQGRSWGELLQAYTFDGGNLWPAVLLVVLAAPSVAAWVRGRGRSVS
jgi:hypothetical protein